MKDPKGSPAYPERILKIEFFEPPKGQAKPVASIYFMGSKNPALVYIFHTTEAAREARPQLPPNAITVHVQRGRSYRVTRQRALNSIEWSLQKMG